MFCTRTSHKFVFLRKEETNIGFDRNPKYLIQDVFFCERCLTYKKIDIRKEKPDPNSMSRLVIERF